MNNHHTCSIHSDRHCKPEIIVDSIHQIHSEGKCQYRKEKELEGLEHLDKFYLFSMQTNINISIFNKLY